MEINEIISGVKKGTKLARIIFGCLNILELLEKGWSLKQSRKVRRCDSITPEPNHSLTHSPDPLIHPLTGVIAKCEFYDTSNTKGTILFMGSGIRRNCIF